MSTLQGNAVRALSSTGDFTFGLGSSGYLQGDAAIQQQASCNVKTILGEVFWDTNFGINWYGFLQSDQTQALALALQTTILNSVNVNGINTSNYSVNPQTREFETQVWNVSTVFSQNVPINVSSPITGGQ